MLSNYSRFIHDRINDDRYNNDQTITLVNHSSTNGRVFFNYPSQYQYIAPITGT